MEYNLNVVYLLIYLVIFERIEYLSIYWTTCNKRTCKSWVKSSDIAMVENVKYALEHTWKMKTGNQEKKRCVYLSVELILKHAHTSLLLFCATQRFRRWSCQFQQPSITMVTARRISTSCFLSARSAENWRHKLTAINLSNRNRSTNYFTEMFPSKFAVNSLLTIPPRLATLPCETVTSENKRLTINYKVV